MVCVLLRLFSALPLCQVRTYIQGFCYLSYFFIFSFSCVISFHFPTLRCPLLSLIQLSTNSTSSSIPFPFLSLFPHLFLFPFLLLFVHLSYLHPTCLLTLTLITSFVLTLHIHIISQALIALVMAYVSMSTQLATCYHHVQYLMYSARVCAHAVMATEAKIVL